MQNTLPVLPIIVCSHHKSGTAYSINTFSEIAKAFNQNLWMKFYQPTPPTADWHICIHQHSRANELLQTLNFRGWHCVRHPKALIYSAMLYHQKSPEPWLDIPLTHFSSDTFWSTCNGHLYNKIKATDVCLEEKQAIMNASYETQISRDFISFESAYDLQGKTYRQFLSGLNSTTDKLLFEMRAFSRSVIHGMLNFPRDQRFYQIRLEDISTDVRMKALTDALIHLGYEGECLLRALNIAASHCLWKIGKSAIQGHATSGMSAVWKEAFSGEVEQEYRRLFGWAEEALGY